MPGSSGSSASCMSWAPLSSFSAPCRLLLECIFTSCVCICAHFCICMPLQHPAAACLAPLKGSASGHCHLARRSLQVSICCKCLRSYLHSLLLHFEAGFLQCHVCSPHCRQQHATGCHLALCVYLEACFPTAVPLCMMHALSGYQHLSRYCRRGLLVA